MKMPGMSQVIFDKGLAQGISQGISQGAEKTRKDDIGQLTEYFLRENPEMSIKQATEMAKGILK